MTTVFVYGTLLDAPLRAQVLGREFPASQTVPATVADHAVRGVQDGRAAALVAAPGETAQGLCLHPLSDAEVDRLARYAITEGQTLQPVTLADGTPAAACVPAGTPTPGPVWDPDGWAASWADLARVTADELTAHAHLPLDEIARTAPRIRARAWSRVLAQRSRHGAGTLRGRMDVLNRRRAYANFFALDEIVLRHETFDGTLSDPIDRGVFVSSDAAIVLPYDPVRDRVLLVEQIRLGPVARRDPVLWQMEPVAGLIDPGEAPETTAHREALEEAGITFRALEPVGECYASPGAATDFFFLYVGLCDLPDNAGGIGGEASEGENIRSHVITFDALMGMAEARQTANAPLTLLAYWLAHHRARLRG